MDACTCLLSPHIWVTLGKTLVYICSTFPNAEQNTAGYFSFCLATGGSEPTRGPEPINQWSSWPVVLVDDLVPICHIPSKAMLNTGNQVSSSGLQHGR